MAHMAHARILAKLHTKEDLSPIDHDYVHIDPARHMGSRPIVSSDSRPA
jgi:hypothetical protein